VEANLFAASFVGLEPADKSVFSSDLQAAFPLHTGRRKQEIQKVVLRT
jgi:hypothetical protein